MKTKYFFNLMLVAFVSITGCSGNHGNLKTQSAVDSKVTQQELIDNWSEYNIWLSYTEGRGLAVIVFDPKNDNRKMLVEDKLRAKWRTVEDQEMWTKIVKANTTSDGDFSLNRSYYGTTGVQEIWGPDNQLYGYIIHLNFVVYWVNVKMVDENTMKLSWQRTPNQGAPL